MTKADRAIAALGGGFNCAQAVFTSLAAGLGLDEETAAKVASAFGGGLARTGATCGAVTGAFMAIGLARGSSRPEESGLKERSYEIAREFTRRFTERNGTVLCRELIGCEILTPEGLARARAEGLFDTVCAKVVRDAVEILEDMLST
jgi:C_GCAxxG_C_C family probable redox protein